MAEAGVAIPRPAAPGGRRATLAVSGRGAFGRYLRRDAAGLGRDRHDRGRRRASSSDLFRVLTDARLLTS